MYIAYTTVYAGPIPIAVMAMHQTAYHIITY